MREKLFELLKIEKGITAIIGAGGKTTLMLALAKELAELGKVIVSTSTKIFEPEVCNTLLNPSAKEIIEALSREKIICVGSRVEIENSAKLSTVLVATENFTKPSKVSAAAESSAEGKKISAPSLSFVELSKLADYVLVEADGSRQLPTKAHANYEPVIPEGTTQKIYVIGIDGVGKKISRACHRPELFCKLTGCELEDLLTSDLIAEAIKKDNLADRFFIKKINSFEEWQLAEDLAIKLGKPTIAGNLWKEEYKCLL